MKVLFVSHSSSLGGSERSLVAVAEAWRELDPSFVPVFIIPAQKKMPLKSLLEEKRIEFKVSVFDTWANKNDNEGLLTRVARNYKNKRATKYIEKVIAIHKADAVISNTSTVPWGAFAAASCAIPHVWLIREFGEKDHGLNYDLPIDEIFSNIQALSAKVVANSNSLADFAKRYIQKNIDVMYIPFNAKKMTKLGNKKIDKHAFKNGKQLKLVSVGRISLSKGQQDVVKAVGELIKNGMDVQLLIIGDGATTSEEESLANLISRLKLDDYVEMLGYVQNPLPYVKRADVGVMSSSNEAFGRTTFEYLYFGKPVVATASGGTLELIDDKKNGLLYEYGDYKQLAKHLEELWSNNQTMRTYSQNAKKKALEIINKKHYVEIYNNLKKQKPALKATSERIESKYYSRKSADLSYSDLYLATKEVIKIIYYSFLLLMQKSGIIS